MLSSASLALRSTLTIVQRRNKFKYIVARRTVGVDDPRRTPTLRQLLTHLDSQSAGVQNMAEVQVEGRPGKIWRKPKRLIQGVYYDSSKIYNIEEVKKEFARQYKTEEVFIEAIATDQERVNSVMAEFDARMKKFSEAEEAVKDKKRADRLARRQVRRALQARVEDGTATKEELAEMEFEEERGIRYEEEDEDEEVGKQASAR